LLVFLVLYFVFFFLSIIPPPPRSTLFPYTTLFRSAVQISAKTDYAVRALLSLAAREPELVKIDVIVTEQGMPRKFVEAILGELRDRKSTRLNSSHDQISYAVFCLKKKKKIHKKQTQ